MSQHFASIRSYNDTKTNNNTCRSFTNYCICIKSGRLVIIILLSFEHANGHASPASEHIIYRDMNFLVCFLFFFGSTQVLRWHRIYWWHTQRRTETDTPKKNTKQHSNDWAARKLYNGKVAFDQRVSLASGHGLHSTKNTIANIARARSECIVGGGGFGVT